MTAGGATVAVVTRARPLTVAITGPTGTFGAGLLPLLEAEPKVGAVVGVARRPFDPAAHGWHKMTYRRGDVRDQTALEDAFAGADVVVHLAFLITGAASSASIREINVEGTLNAWRAAVAAGAKRFVYSSSVAAYGFHADNPSEIDEDWPTRPASHLFYAQEKAELEELLAEEAAGQPGPDLYLLRPPIVLGPHVVGGKGDLLARLLPVGQRLSAAARGLPLHVPMPAPDVPMQFIHEEDVGQAIVCCVLGSGPPGAYNIAGPGIVTGADLVRELGFHPVAIPTGIVQRTARAIAALPMPSFVPPVAGWAEAVSHPVIMDVTKAERELGWHPRYSGLQALRATLAASD